MRQRRTAFLLTLLAFADPTRAALHAFAYHDVRDVVAANYDADQYAISTETLIAHFSWLRANGYTPVSLADIADAADGRRQLPTKAVLLTFDDGLISTYTHVFPLLKLFNFPAVVSVVTAWIDNDGPVDYGGRLRDRTAFVSWEQLAEMQASGLVEIASHSNDLHRGVVGNPQGNVQPAAVTRQFVDGHYETADEYAARIRADLERSFTELEQRLGPGPRAITWPYGESNEITRDIAVDAGAFASLGLGIALNETIDIAAINREVVTGNPELEDFTTSLLYPPAPPVLRAAQVDLDYLFDADSAQQERNLDRLIARVYALGISHVFLQAFADPDADGGADALYFPNEHLPVRADLFNRVAWQLKTRARVSVYAWLPMLSYVGPAFDSDWRVLAAFDNGRVEPDSDAEPRLTPFDEDAKARIADVYRDLAAHASFDGLLFHDDGRLSDREDLSPAARAAFRRAFGIEYSSAALAEDPKLAARWARLKSRAIVEHSRELTRVVRRYRPDAKTARNLFATALLDARGEGYLAQNYAEFLATYDYVALMAMPGLEGVAAPRPFYTALVDAVARAPSGLAQTLFELQAVDWHADKPIAGAELRDTMRWLQSLGVRHLGYYPDDFITGQPELEPLREGISLIRYPGTRP
jgi:biofilm PGA synthesis lipoprotein PgaB